MICKTFDIFAGLDRIEEEKTEEIIPESFCGLIIGRPGAGKSTLIELLLNAQEGFFKKFDLVLFIAPSEIADLKIPQSRFNNSIDHDWISNTIEEIRNKKGAHRFSRNYKFKVLLVIDDQIAVIKKAQNDPQMIKMFNNRRHQYSSKDEGALHPNEDTDVSIIVTTQKFKTFPPQFRSGVQFVILFQTPVTEYNAIIEEYLFSKKGKLIEDKIDFHFKRNRRNFVYIRCVYPSNVYLNFKELIS